MKRNIADYMYFIILINIEVLETVYGLSNNFTALTLAQRCWEV